MQNVYKKLGFYAVALFMATSCADTDPLGFEVQKPTSVALQEEINAYDDLKAYVNRDGNSQFKLGAGISLAEYMDQGAFYRMINRNFDEVTTGYAMKHGAIVQNDGSLALGDVVGLLDATQKAGISVYGHTLCWHANQNAEYLNSTIEPTVIPGSGEPTWEVVTEADFETEDDSNYQSNTNAVMSFTADGEGANGEGRALQITNAEVRANDWDAQFFITFSPETVVGERYTLTFDVRADVEATFPTQAHVVPYQYKHWDFFGAISATTEWTTYTAEITINDNTSGTTAIAFNLGATATSYYFDNVKLTRLNESGAGPTWDLISGADFETADASNYESNTNAVMSFTADGEGANGEGRALQITNAEVRPNDWDAQFFITFSPQTELGERYTLTMDIRADVEATFPTQAHVVPYQYKHWDFFGALTATTEWTTYTREITINDNTSGTTAIAFNLGATATTYYFDNITLTKYNESGGGEQIVEKTDEEKKEIITGELERWIAGMMEVSKEHVKAWDVVNEPMDDGNPYELKTGVGRELAEDEFYWQDYMGEDYAVKAIEFARQYGNPDDLLFINDYNLEYNLDKCKGIIQYVEYIESQGVTVDGIGTQMHLSIDSDKDNIKEMFELLAATGKLIKISELDIGVGVTTSEATDEHYVAQAEMYKYVVDQYMAIVPASQRYGITVWSPKDSPEGSSWRAGEPIGLWTEGYDRKRAYSAFADALEGK